MSRETHRPLTVAALLFSVAMSAMEATVVGTAMPTVVSELGGLALYGWVGSVYLLASTVSMPVYGKLCDLHGRKRVLLFGIAMFLLGSVLSGLATSIHVLIFARAVQGLGAGAMQPVSLTIIGDLFTLEERARIQGVFGAVWGVAGIVGPLLGGALVHLVSWRWVFWINVPFGVASVVILSRAFHEAPRTGARPPLDLAGALVLTLGSTALLLGASRELPLLMLPAGAILFVLFGILERRAADPVLPLGLVFDRAIGVATVSSALLGACMMGTLMFVPLYAQGVLGRSPTESGAAVAPMLIGWPIASAATSRLLGRTGFRAPVWLGSVVCAAALALFAWELGEHSGLLRIQATMFAYGVGMGFANTALIIAVQSAVEWNQRGVATALSMFARSVGGALGVGALGSVLAASLGASLPVEQVTALLDPHARAGLGAPDPAIVTALAAALEPLFRGIAALAILNLVAVAFYPRHHARAARHPADLVEPGA